MKKKRDIVDLPFNLHQTKILLCWRYSEGWDRDSSHRSEDSRLGLLMVAGQLSGHCIMCTIHTYLVPMFGLYVQLPLQVKLLLGKLSGFQGG